MRFSRVTTTIAALCMVTGAPLNAQVANEELKQLIDSVPSVKLPRLGQRPIAPNAPMEDFAKQAKELADKVIAEGRLSNIDQYQAIDPARLEQAAELAKQVQESMREKLLQEGMQQNQVDALAGQGPEPYENKPKPEAVLFVSSSMPESQLKAAYKYAEQRGIVVYYRGLLPGTKNIPQSIARVRKQVASLNLKSEPKIGIDPIAFDDHDITVVPTLVISRDGQQAMVSGLFNLDYLQEQLVAAPADTDVDLGSRGTVYDIKERHLVAEMKARAANIDWKAKQKETVASYWQRKAIPSLPRATKDEQFWIDPTVRVTKDVLNAQGDLLARAGETFNPIAKYVLHITYLIIDASSEAQIRWAQAQLAEITGQFQLMITGLNRSRGWDGYTEIRQRLKVPVFVMPALAKQRFQLTAVPAKVATTESGYLQVNQYQLKDEL
ncbi:TrbC family F-type conjugative pilus assembly protein [Ferrimonas kyonanensis]|uniref:TrbC family F-type conjugative pilus assembly protein n=1 Tax=Ferrimonas kyonanensis TaxID=364763 RepID=UPI000401DE28|nr:TrbC family F-type conjugative pilus assembly protein [Ferrimonas kyonanensis]